MSAAQGPTVAANGQAEGMETSDSNATPSRVTRVEFQGVRVSLLDDEGGSRAKFDAACDVVAEYDPEGMLMRICKAGGGGATLQEFLVKKTTESAKVGRRGVIFHLDVETILLRFDDEEQGRKFRQMVSGIAAGSKASVFQERTEDSSAMQYFQFYGYLSQQQNMMQDYIRTSTYQRAILSNMTDFRDKVVLDVGAGSGILSFFAQQAGARKVYAVEGSSIAKHAEALVKANKVGGVIQVISGKIEEVELPEKVDMIISEPMGYMLLNERMLETYLHAKKWLKPDGRMFPSRGDLHVAPFSDEALYMEQINKVNFWYQDYFHGVNLSTLRDAALKEYFRQPIVDTFDIRICLAKTQRHIIDFQKAHETELHQIEIPLEFHVIQSGTVHGLAFWFDVAFIGTGATVWLSTAPTEPLTHWYQVRCLLEQPIFVKQGQVLSGRVLMKANMKQSYDVTIECSIVGTSTKSQNSLDLKNPYFRYTGVQPQPPPGENHVSPSESYWSQVDMQGARQAVNLVNGMIVDGLGHVSLDSGGNPAAAGQPQAAHTGAVAGGMNQANIHQGSILATGRKTDSSRGGGASAAGASAPTTPMSAANSLQFNQLIGGAISPNLMSNGAALPAAAPAAMGHQQAQGLNLVQQQVAGGAVNPNLMIGDYMQPAAAGASQTGPQQAAAAFRQ